MSIERVDVVDTPLVDEEGFLLDLNHWGEDIAQQIAQAEGISLSTKHWEVIHLLRAFYKRFHLSPANRALVSYTRKQLGDDKGKSAYLMRLFGGSPAKTAAKIAGLPKPDNCL